MENTFSNNSFVQETISSQLLNERIDEIKDYGFNPVAMYFGEDYKVNDEIVIRQPSIQDFIDSENGEAIYDVIIPFVTNTTECRAQLWDMGIDWNKITNYELFSMLIKNIQFRYSQLIFGDIDFSSFDLYSLENGIGGDKRILYSEKMDMFLEEETVEKMCKYIQYLFYQFPPEEEFVSNKTLKVDLINRDKEKLFARKREAGKSGKKSTLLPMISFYLTHPGTVYKKDDLREVKYFQFIYDIQRLQIYESTHALFGGMYSGFCDLKGIDKKEFNFMRDVNVSL